MPLLLVERRSGCETIVLRLSVGLSMCVSVSVCVCVCLCLSAMTLKWHNIVNFQYIAIQLYLRVDTTPEVRLYLNVTLSEHLEQLRSQPNDTLYPQIFKMQYIHT